MFKIKDYPFLKDSAPYTPLSEIFPFSKRATVLLLRNQQKQIVDDDFVSIFGAVDMIDGLEYHHDNLITLVQQRSTISIRENADDKERKIIENNLRHEAVAYLNRAGQFYHFANSQLVKNHIPDVIQRIPTITKLKFFRDKHAAHRSIDKPLPHDDPHAQKIQAWGLSSVSSLSYSPKSEIKSMTEMELMLNEQALWLDHYLCFQMRGREKEEFVNFSVEREHPNILVEAFNLVEKLVLI